MKTLHNYIISSWFVFLVAFSVGCSGDSSVSDSPSNPSNASATSNSSNTVYPNTSIGVTQKLFDSISENDPNKYLDAITLEDRRQPGFFFYRNLMQGLFGIVGAGNVDAADPRVDFRDMNYIETYNDGSTAIVQVTGTIRDLNLAMEDSLSAQVVTVQRNGTWLVSVSTDAATVIPTVIPQISNVVNVGGWRVFVTNVQESPSGQRGWKTVQFDVVYESTMMRPGWVYRRNMAYVIDSTGTERRVGLLVHPDFEDTTRSWGRIGASFVPTGGRFFERGRVEIPENATIEEYRMRTHGGHDWYLSDALPNQEISFPFSQIPSEIPDLSEPITLEEAGLVTLTFSGPATLGEGMYNSLHVEFTLRIENLSSDNIDASIVDEERIGVTILTDSGLYSRSHIYCPFDQLPDQVIPPTFDGTVTCRILVFWRDNLYSKVWVALIHNQTNTYIFQTMVDRW